METKILPPSRHGLYADLDHHAPELSPFGLRTPRSHQYYDQIHHDVSTIPTRYRYQEDIPDQQSEPHPGRVCGLLPATFWLSIAFITALTLAGALAGGIGGHYKNQLDLCQANTGALTAKLNTSHPPQCVDRQPWASNLTDLTYTKICNADLQDAVDRNNAISAVTATFDSCLYMCDTYSRVSKETGGPIIDVAVWSENGNGTGGYLNANEPGKCWCVQTRQINYRMARIIGAQAGLLDRSFTNASLPQG